MYMNDIGDEVIELLNNHLHMSFFFLATFESTSCLTDIVDFFFLFIRALKRLQRP